MEAIASLLAAIMTLPVFIPFIAFVLVYYLLLWKRKSKHEAMVQAINVTTFFLIIAVIIMYRLISDKGAVSAGWWVLLFFLAIGIIIAFLQFKVKRRLDVHKIARGTWRLAFLVFTVVYFVMFIKSILHFVQLT